MFNNLITWIHILDHVPQYFNFDTGDFEDTRLTKSRLYTFIQKEGEAIKSALKGYYPNLYVTSISTILLTVTRNQNKDFILNPDYVIKNVLSTKVYRFEVTEVNGPIISFTINVEGGASFTLTSDNDFDLGDITIEKEAWTNQTFGIGDIFYLGTTYCDSVILDLCAKAVAAKVLEQTYASETSGVSADARLLRDQVNRTISDLIDPNNPMLLSVARNDIDLTPIGFSQGVNAYGEDESTYKDDEINI